MLSLKSAQRTRSLQMPLKENVVARCSADHFPELFVWRRAPEKAQNVFGHFRLATTTTVHATWVPHSLVRRPSLLAKKSGASLSKLPRKNAGCPSCPG